MSSTPRQSRGRLGCSPLGDGRGVGNKTFENVTNSNDMKDEDIWLRMADLLHEHNDKTIKKELRKLADELERLEPEYNPCSTDCALFRQGTCPFDWREKEEKCPRWKLAKNKKAGDG